MDLLFDSSGQEWPSKLVISRFSPFSLAAFSAPAQRNISPVHPESSCNNIDNKGPGSFSVDYKSRLDAGLLSALP